MSLKLVRKGEFYLISNSTWTPQNLNSTLKEAYNEFLYLRAKQIPVNVLPFYSEIEWINVNEIMSPALKSGILKFLLKYD